jgi:hypothetical protein
MSDRVKSGLHLMFLLVEVERCALERAASVHRRGTQPADAKHFDWRTTFVANVFPKTGHNAAVPRSFSLLVA